MFKEEWFKSGTIATVPIPQNNYKDANHLCKIVLLL